MRYGLTVALLRAGDSRRAQTELAALLKLGVTNPMFDALVAQTLIANRNTEKGLEAYRLALRSHPGRRALTYGYADALITAGRARDATDFLDTRLDNRTADPRLYELQARAYADMGRRLLQHQAQAEAYVLRGSLLGAIEQLQIAQRAGDGDFYQQSAVEARLRELIAIDTENRQTRP
jgi:predicted Zn-dependent protease